MVLITCMHIIYNSIVYINDYHSGSVYMYHYQNDIICTYDMQYLAEYAKNGSK